MGVKLEFGKGSFPGFDESVLDGQINASFIDGYQDDTGAYFKRPGLLYYGGHVPQPVQGIFWSIRFSCFIAVGGGKIYRVSTSGVFSACPGVTFSSVTTPATFAENSTHVFVTAGGQMAITDGLTSNWLSTGITALDNGSTHLGWLDGHIIANQAGTNYFWYTDSDGVTWDVNNSESANADMDTIVALTVFNRELYLFGTRSTEIWYNTGQTPGTFQRQEGAFITRGCSAPYSIVQANNTLFWLDHERAFIMLDGRSPKIISQPIQTILLSYSDVSDFTATYAQWQNQRFIFLTSAINNITFVYDVVLDAWYRWGSWDAERYTYDFLPVRFIAFNPTNRFVVLVTDGSVRYFISTSSTARFLLRSAHISHGTDQWKMSKELLIRLKRGFTTTSTSTDVSIRWRDQGKNWSNERFISLNKTGNYDQIEHIHRLGRYRNRQWELLYTGDDSFAFVNAEEDVEVLDE